MRVNAHLHLNFNRMSVTDVLRYLDDRHFDYAWLLTWEESEPGGWPYQHLSVEHVWDAFTRYPNRIIPMYAPDPKRHDASERLVAWYHRGIKGCAELKTALPWNATPVKSFLATVAKLRIPLVFHMEGKSDYIFPLKTDGSLLRMIVRILVSRRLPGLSSKRLCECVRLQPLLKAFLSRRTINFPGYLGGFKELEDVLKAFPEISFVGHGPLFWEHLSAVEGDSQTCKRRTDGITYRLLKTYANLYADISGYSGFCALTRDIRFASQFLNELGHKILFGTDNETVDHESLINSFHLPQPVKNSIFGENACRLLEKTIL